MARFGISPEELRVRDPGAYAAFERLVEERVRLAGGETDESVDGYDFIPAHEADWEAVSVVPVIGGGSYVYDSAAGEWQFSEG